MRHYIIVKFKPEVDWGVLVEPIRALFQRTLDIEGITGVWTYPSNSCRADRSHLMIEMELTAAALETYDRSELHFRWKETYGPLLESKIIFDRES